MVGLFEDDFYVGKIIQKDSQDRYLIWFRSRLKQGVADKDKYWIFPVTEDKQLINYSSILSIMPQIEIEMVMCTTRMVVMRLHNHEIIRNWCTFK